MWDRRAPVTGPRAAEGFEYVAIAWGHARCMTRKRRSVSRRHDGGLVMDDVLFVGLTVGFFVLTWALIRLCERL
jgi:hypothetical protein